MPRLVKSKPSREACGAIAQLGERIVRNDEVVGSIPTSSTMYNPFVSVTYSLPIFACTNLYHRILTELNFCLTFFPVFMHLFFYTRHAAKCPSRRDRCWRRCHCQKWIKGVINKNPIPLPACTTTWTNSDT